ncbi:protein PET117, putative [Pediculus humanus corporis]|uniref:Protein PET117, putative n=1 Tax=Pediculus humanus subsp. corporis TaxID=121224 RepID=E0VF19_PEDHC|nr:protein PET117, putative [Pediculus humanus corporis]EEB11993.1 protein PET117, putative [Pediculus humanus corporis]
MSLASKITLGLACTLTAGIIVFVNAKDWIDKKNMHKGVLKDVERQQKKKIENLYWLEKQVEMTKILKQKQNEEKKIVIPLLEDDKKGEF